MCLDYRGEKNLNATKEQKINPRCFFSTITQILWKFYLSRVHSRYIAQKLLPQLAFPTNLFSPLLATYFRLLIFSKLVVIKCFDRFNRPLPTFPHPPSKIPIYSSGPIPLVAEGRSATSAPSKSACICNVSFLAVKYYCMRFEFSKKYQKSTVLRIKRNHQLF